jgi:hypothetical protein
MELQPTRSTGAWQFHPVFSALSAIPARLHRMSRPSSRRLVCCVLAMVGSGCIKRTAPPAAGPGKAAADAAAALAAKNARIADVPRTDLVGSAGLAAFALQGAEVAKATVTRISVTGMPFAEALRAEVREETGHEWAVQLQAPTAAPVEEGDALLATFYLRTEVPQPGSVGETQFVFELAQAPYTKSVTYPVQGSAEWSRVQVRFAAHGTYAAGEAQMIFRLGYDRQVLQIGGIKIENFGKHLAVGALPATLALDRRRERDNAEARPAGRSAPQDDQNGGELIFAVVPGQILRPISPLVYGINAQPTDDTGATVRRAGGNRQTAYNWEIDASNAGSDYHHSSDLWACTALGYRDCEAPGSQYLDFARANHAAGMDTVVTIPLVDWVVADRDGAVAEGDKAPSKRWARSLPRKPGPFTLTPDLADGVVYQDELVNLLVHELGAARDGGIRFYSLDNEPALWPVTHPRVHPAKTRYDEMVKRTEAAAAAITRVDPGAMTLGAVMFGWSEIMNLVEAPDAKENDATYGTYTDFFLAAMKDLEAKHGRRLVHVLDVHWYPEARGRKRIIEKDVSPPTVAARLQAPRSLWDPTYVEKSWIASTWGRPIRLIPWLQERIDQRYPGTKLAITEYDYGAGDHVSGGLAEVDVLGVLGREGVYLANYWGAGPGNGDLPAYIKAAFRLYRNYDGHHGTFGDTAVVATTADQGKASIFAATDSKRPGTLTIIAINKELRASLDARLDIRGGGYGKAEVFVLDGSKPEVRPAGNVELRNDRLDYRLPPLSATLFVCRN